MSLDDIEALTFDTGGTILDWHGGFSAALAEAGANHGIEKDWAALANDLRRRSLKRMLKLGEHAPPAYNFDDAHRAALDEVIAENGLDAFTIAGLPVFHMRGLRLRPFVRFRPAFVFRHGGVG